MRALFAMLFILAGLAACGPQTAYDSLRYRQSLQCDTLYGADRDDCYRRSGMSYDEYERQRSRETR